MLFQQLKGAKDIPDRLILAYLNDINKLIKYSQTAKIKNWRKFVTKL